MTNLEFLVDKPEVLSKSIMDWFNSVLKSANIRLTKESLDQQEKIFVDWFNEERNNESSR